MTHPNFEIKHLLVDYEHSNLDDLYNYVSTPLGLGYYPEETQKHPWYQDNIDAYDLPAFFLGNWQEVPFGKELENRDMVAGFGSEMGSLRMARLLLNASTPQNQVNEYDLEDEKGFRGVGRASAEVSLFLPGSRGWNGEIK